MIGISEIEMNIPKCPVTWIFKISLEIFSKKMRWLKEQFKILGEKIVLFEMINALM